MLPLVPADLHHAGRGGPGVVVLVLTGTPHTLGAAGGEGAGARGSLSALACSAARFVLCQLLTRSAVQKPCLQAAMLHQCRCSLGINLREGQLWLPREAGCWCASTHVRWVHHGGCKPVGANRTGMTAGIGPVALLHSMLPTPKEL